MAGQARRQPQEREGTTRTKIQEVIKVHGSGVIAAQQLDCISNIRKLVQDRQRAARQRSSSRAPLKNVATLQHVGRIYAVQQPKRDQ